MFWKSCCFKLLRGEHLVSTKCTTLPLTPKSKIKHVALGSFGGSPYKPQQYQWCIYKQQTERSQWIFNECSVWNFEQAQIDSWFFNGACGSFQNCWLFLTRWANIHSWGKRENKNGAVTQRNFSIFSPVLWSLFLGQSFFFMLLRVTWWHWDSNTL